MYLSEEIYREHVEILRREGFPDVYVWQDEAGLVYDEHFHKDRVSLFVEKGGVNFSFEDGTKRLVSEGERFDVPVGKKHSAIVSDNGCIYVVGQMTDDDA